MSVDEILMSIENLDNDEREKILMIIKEKYDLTNKLLESGCPVSDNYNFWLNEDDDMYDDI